MPSIAPTKTITIALVGNPNTGKSTLFTALAGVRQHVGNYPGVTVEKKIGRMTHEGTSFTLVDLPGTYSLAPRSPDEMVAVDLLLGRQAESARPDAVLCVVDAGNIERNLYLVSQALELGLPTVVALNMIDVARERGTTIDVPLLSRRLGVPVVELQANRAIGIDRLKGTLLAASAAAPPTVESPFSAEFRDEVRKLESFRGPHSQLDALPRYLLERLLLDTSGYLSDTIAREDSAGLKQALVEARERLAKVGQPVPAVEAMARYGWVGKLLEGVVKRDPVRRTTLSDRIDRVLTDRVFGTAFFALMMVVVFQAVFTWAGPLMGLIESCVGLVADFVKQRMAEGALRSLLVDGIIGGVGGVIIFLPQILILFLFIGILEDCGYMARAAYLMDKLMVRVGLSGKSFIPLLSSFACAIPGVMATRVIENRRDRLTTMLIAPLMSCSARIPVYTLLIAAFIPARSWLGGWLGQQGLVMFAMYLVGIVAAVAVAWLLKRTMLRGPTPPFVMELPSYKMPAPLTVVYRMLDRGWAFLSNAGTIILAVSIVVWAALYYPHDAATIEAPFQAQKQAIESRIDSQPQGSEERKAAEEELAALENHIHGAYQRQSYLGRAGHTIEPLVRPLGWDWRIGCAAIASFPAREVVVATLGIIYDLGGDIDVDDQEQSGRLQTALAEATWDGTDRKVFNLATALSIMVFFALCAQCAATLAIIKRETNSWRWPIFTFTYMTGLAYIAALITYQVTIRLIA
ncbi:MAG: ferrous iron transport protein B [Planctomycetia bacterium]|nr:ferrous iron transport protein B [Planctomycetia bacterium]